MLPVPPPQRSYAALPLGWAALLLYLTLAPADRLPPQPKWELLSFDTFAHAAFFAVQAVLTWFWLRRQTRWPALARYAGLAVLLGCTAFGAAIEALQMVLPFNRHGEWSDLISDSLGTALALGLCRLAAPALQRRGWALGLLLVLGFGSAQAQDIQRARKTIATLASRRMHGRGYVKQGEHKAAAYLRGRLRGLGLQPLAADYTQPFTLDVNTFPGNLRGIIELRLEKKRIKIGLGKPGNAFIASPTSGNGSLKSALVAALDTAVFTNTQAQQQLFRTPLADKVLMLTAHDAARLPALPTYLRQHLDSAAAWVKKVPKLTASVASARNHPIELELLWQENAKPEPSGIRIMCNVPGPAWTMRTSLDVQSQLVRDYPTQNLAALIPGRVQPDSFLVVSAHYDHLGMMGRKTYFPGANDNASGVALLLELAAHYAKPENRPACSLVFLLFGAEEAGLLGSRYFVAHPLVPLPRIKFLVNLDLLGTGEEGATVVNGKVFPAAFAQLTKLNDAHHYLPSLGARGKAANSDHYPFSEAGVPAFFIYTRGGSQAYHDVNDRPEALSLAGFAGAFGLVRDFLDGQ